MFTSLDLDDKLFQQARSLSKIKTKKGLVEEALRIYVRLHEQAQVRELRGKLLWKGDLEALREERLANPR